MKTAEVWYVGPEGRVMTDVYQGDHVTHQMWPDGRLCVAGRNVTDTQGPVDEALYHRVVKSVRRPNVAADGQA